MKPAAPVLTLEIIVRAPPPGVAIAVQEGQAGKATITQRTLSQGQDLTFEIPVTADAGDFRGPYVQGKKGERFVYLTIGTSAGQPDSVWTRRAKIHLRDLPASALRTGGRIRAEFDGTARDGGPLCATCPPLAPGWTVVEG